MKHVTVMVSRCDSSLTEFHTLTIGSRKIINIDALEEKKSDAAFLPIERKKNVYIDLWDRSCSYEETNILQCIEHIAVNVIIWDSAIDDRQRRNNFIVAEKDSISLRLTKEAGLVSGTV